MIVMEGLRLQGEAVRESSSTVGHFLEAPKVVTRFAMLRLRWSVGRDFATPISCMGRSP